jgi:hypothetical protein
MDQGEKWENSLMFDLMLCFITKQYLHSVVQKELTTGWLCSFLGPEQGNNY